MQWTSPTFAWLFPKLSKMLWATLFVMLYKALCMTVVKGYIILKEAKDRRRTNTQASPIFDTTTIRNSIVDAILLGLGAAFTVQAWNVLEIYVLHCTTRLVVVTFYLFSVILILYQSFRPPFYPRHQSILNKQCMLIVAVAIGFNWLCKTTVQYYARGYFVHVEL